MTQQTRKGVDVFDALLDDICGREALGFEIHGKPLRTFDGRDWLQEAYEEVLDTAVYLKAALMERAAPADAWTGPAGAEWMNSVGHGPLDDVPASPAPGARGRPPTEEDDVIRTNCAHCGAILSSDRRAQWLGAVNLTVDLLMIGRETIDFGEAVYDEDLAYDWCNVACFGRWLFDAAEPVTA